MKSEELMITYSKFMNYSRFGANRIIFFLNESLLVDVYTVCFFGCFSSWPWSLLDLMSFVI